MNGQGRTTFWQELGRRNVLRVGAAYAVASFAMIEVVSNVTPGLHLPDWVLSLVIVLLALGFPAALAFSWVYEVTPEGLKRTDDVEGKTSITHRTAHRLNAVIIAMMLVLAGLYGADGLLPMRDGAQIGTKAPVAEGGVTIAVLPFLNLSSDKEQEFFSDGMTEEITSALAEVKGLQVVGRTSAFQFKGENKDLRAIGQALGATNLLEGSVRKAGDRIRVTGQLIRADNGHHIWTASYDRDLKDIFAVQEEVAKAIAEALQVPLGLQSGETLIANRTADTNSYQDYLRAKALFRQRAAFMPLREPIGLLEQMLAQDPSYAPGWALIANVYQAAPAYDDAFNQVDDLRRAADIDLTKAEAAARRAIALDARSADGYGALAQTMAVRGKLVEAEELFGEALKRDPYNPDTLHWYGLFLASVGNFKEANAPLARLQSIEPLVPVFTGNTALVLLAAGDTKATLALTKADPLRFAGVLAKAYATMGDYKAAASVVENAADSWPARAATVAARLLRSAPQPVPDQNLPDLGTLSFAYAHVGLPERALAPLRREIGAGYQATIEFVKAYGPAYGPARKTQLFKELMLKSGRVDYWRARGWPDMCRPLGADDFECS